MLGCTFNTAQLVLTASSILFLLRVLITMVLLSWSSEAMAGFFSKTPRSPPYHFLSKFVHSQCKTSVKPNALPLLPKASALPSPAPCFSLYSLSLGSHWRMHSSRHALVHSEDFYLVHSTFSTITFVSGNPFNNCLYLSISSDSLQRPSKWRSLSFNPESWCISESHQGNSPPDSTLLK